MLMRIEKINDNQIRCTLTKEDLASRQLKLSELAYGTEKAKRLFREMMQQANFEFGFEAEDIPLMIEAIPMNSECIVLLITKVEDPEELDARFARLSPGENDDNEDEDDEDLPFEIDDLSDLSSSFPPQQSDDKINPENSGDFGVSSPSVRIFAFRTLSEVMNASAQIGKNCPCNNALYKDPKSDQYLLVIWKEDVSMEVYNRLCNTLSEYGRAKRGTVRADFLEEHCEAVLKEEALQKLAF